MPLKNNYGQKIYDMNSQAEPYGNTMQEQFKANPGRLLPEVTSSIREINEIRSKFILRFISDMARGGKRVATPPQITTQKGRKSPPINTKPPPTKPNNNIAS